MSKIKIITDSTSDIPRNIIDKYDIAVLPLTVLFGEEQYKDWVDITPSDFFKRMRESEKLPTTSMVTPNEFSTAYETYLKEYDEIISIHLSSSASGTYNSALLAKEMIKNDRIHVIDTKNYTYGYGQFVVEAAIMARDGNSSNEIIEKLKYFNENLKTLFVVDTLEYLKKGGRLSATKATIGTLLNLKPILTVKEGQIIAIDKARGFKKALKRIAEIIQEEGSDLGDQILKVKIGHADNYEHLKIFKNVLEENFGTYQFEEFEVGCVIGVYCGPGTVVIHYF